MAKTPLEKLNAKYGVKTTSKTKSNREKLKDQLDNYNTRLSSLGYEDVTDTRNWFEKLANLEQDQNVLFDIFELLDRPRNALFTGIDEAAQGGSFLEGLKEGFTGETDTTGKDLLLNYTNLDDEEGKLNAVDVLGFGLDVVGDPTNWVTFGGKTVADLGVDAIAKGAKKLGGFADNVITKGLTALDNKQLKALQKAAGDMNVDDFLKQFGKTTDDYLFRANAYGDLKKGVTNVFNQGKTALGKLKLSRKQADSLNNLLDRSMKNYSDDLGESAYKYILNNLDEGDELLKYTDDIEALNNYLQNNKRVVDFINETDSDFAKILKQRQNTVAEDILDVIESNRSTRINPKRALEELTKTGSFTGDEKSVKEIKRLLDKTAKESGLKKIDIIEDLSKNRNADAIGAIKDELAVGNITKKQAKDQIDALLRQQSGLSVSDTGIIKKYADNPNFVQAFNNLDLNRSWEYTADEFNRISNLKKNQAFMDLVSQNENAYKDLATKIKNVTGLDYSDIVNNPAYVRRARGSIDDIDGQIDKLTQQLNKKGLSESEIEVIQDSIDILERKKNRLYSGSTDAFSSREYTQPTVVANRQFEEARKAKISEIRDKIDNLQNNYSDIKRETLEETLENLSNPRIDNLKKQNEKLAKRIEDASTSFAKNQVKISEIVDNMNDNFITKMIDTQDAAFSKSLNKSIDKANKLSKEMADINKQLEKAVDPDEIAKLTNKYTKLSDNYNKVTDDLRKRYDIVDGNIDKKIEKGIAKQAKSLDSYEKSVLKRDAIKAKQADLAAKQTVVKDKISELKASLDNKIKRINFDLESIKEANDAKIDLQIKALSTTKSILESQAGQTLFDRNFYAGIDDFLNYTEYTNKTAQVFKDALTMGVFEDDAVVKNIKNIDKVPKGWKRVSGDDIANRLNSLQNIISDSDPQKIIGSGKDAKSVKDWIETLRGETLYMDERVANLFNNVTTKAAPQELHTILNFVDKANNLFKKFSVLSPGFQVRNYLGNSMNMYLSGMPASQILNYQSKATKLLNSADDVLKKFAKEGIDALTDDEKFTFNMLKQFHEGGFDAAGTAVRDLEKVADDLKLGNKSNLLNKATSLNMKLNENADAMNRMALLMYANENSKYLTKLGAKTPIEAVKYALMDPSNLSDVEQNVIKRLIPFYTFTKQNLMFQASNMIKNVGRYKNVMKSINNMYEDTGEGAYYDYQKSNMQIPLNLPIVGGKDSDGNQLFLKANLPLADLGEWLSDPKQKLASSFTPLIKMPVEAATGKSTFTGEDIRTDSFNNLASNLGIELPSSVQNFNSAAEYILNNLGLQNVSSNVAKKISAILENASGEKSSQQLWAEIFRSLLQSVNEENVELSKMYDDLEVYQAAVKQLKDQGIDVPTIRDITSSNSIKLNNIKRKRTRL